MKISIIITCYNYGRFVADAINSALSQTYPNTEVIVVNDGSTDNSHDVISQFADNITYINQINSGAATARNNGFKMASGEYCVCLDADDWISPDYVTDAVKLISDDSTIVSPIVHLADANLNITASAVWPTDEIIKTNKSTVRCLLLCNRATNCSVFPRNKWRQVGGYDPQNPKAEDYGLWIDLVAVGCKILYMDKNKMYVLYRKHGPSRITSVSDEQQFDYTYTKHGIFETKFSRKEKIQALYKFYLDRDADPNGLQHYFTSNLSILQIRDILFNSEEYKKRWEKNIITNITNTEFPFKRAADFSEFEYNQSDIDIQGWGGNHPIFAELIQKKLPKMICDVGVWKGQSTINMAECLKNTGQQGLVFGVDTFLGSPWMWYNTDDSKKSLKLIHGYPTFYYTFLANVFNNGVENFVIPVPATTYSAYLMFVHSNIKFDLIHIDAEHEYSEVKNDIENYWNLLNEDGVMICDDYSPSWPGVVKAVDEFVQLYKLKFEQHDYKAVIYKQN